MLKKAKKRTSLRVWNLNSENAPYFPSVFDHPITERTEYDE
jgi:hypothetical protein